MKTTRFLLYAAALPIVTALQLGASCATTNYEERTVYHQDAPPIYRDGGTVYHDGGPVYREPPPVVYQPDRPVYVPGDRGYGPGGYPPVVYRDGDRHDDVGRDDGARGDFGRDRGPHNDDDRPNRIPRFADQVRDGKGKQRWTADFDGVIYVYDPDKDFIPWTGPIRRGQEVIVIPGDDEIRLDDHPVFKQNLRKDGRYEIYFERAGRRNEVPPGRPAPLPAPVPPPRGGSWSGPRDLPHGADVIRRGGGDLSLDAAPRDGTVFVFDEDDRRVVYAVDLARGNSFQMFPGRDFVNVNSKRAADVQLRRDHKYTLYFAKK